jgi:hypothetical protein
VHGGFEERNAKAFVLAQADEQVGLTVIARKLCLGDLAGSFDCLHDPVLTGQLTQFSNIGGITIANQYQFRRARQAISKMRERHNQIMLTLVLRNSADE